MGSLGQDVRNAFRQIRRNPGVAVAVVLTLGLAMGGVTAVFTLADRMIFRPLPYPDADRIVRLSADTDSGPSGLFLADYFALQDREGPFEAVGNYRSPLGYGRLIDDANPDTAVLVNGVSPGFWDIFGVQPVIGRTFTPEEYRGAPVAIITHGLWQDFYGGRRDIVGQALRLYGPRGTVFEIVGVLPASFLFPDFFNEPPVAVAPTEIDPAGAGNSQIRSSPFAKLKPGVSIAQAASAIAPVLASVEQSGEGFQRLGPRTPRLRPLRTSMYSQARSPLFMLLAVTAFVMLLATANLAHLFLARGTARARELATRQALGASRWRLARMLIVEAVVLAAFGAVAALAIGRVLRDAMIGLLPDRAHVYHATPAVIDFRILLALLVLTVAALVIFGLIPAVMAARRDLKPALSATPGAGRKGAFARGALVAAQTAAALAVVLTAVLLAVSFTRLVNQELGFTPQGVMQATASPPLDAYKDPARIRRLNREMQRRVAEIAGTPVALSDGMPGMTLPMLIGSLDLERQHYQTIAYPVSAEFFGVFGIRLVRGRLMSEQEALNGQPVVIVDERAASLSWTARDPIGQQMRDSSGAVRTVIGVVTALKTHLVGEGFQRATAFVPLRTDLVRPVRVVWRGPATPELERDIRAAARLIEPDAATSVGPLNLFDRELGMPKFLASLLGALAVLAIALTIVGLYGVVSHAVAERTREMGIRLALGAEAHRIVRLVVMQALKPALVGVALGLSVSLWWTESLRAMLHGIEPHDWRVFAVAAVVVMTLVGIASLLPARRATRVDPMITLKSE